MSSSCLIGSKHVEWHFQSSVLIESSHQLLVKENIDEISISGRHLTLNDSINWGSQLLKLRNFSMRHWKQSSLLLHSQVNILIAIVFVLASIFLVIVGTIDSPIDTAIGFGIMLTGIPVYFLLVYPKQLPKWLSKIQGKMRNNVRLVITLKIIGNENLG